MPNWGEVLQEIKNRQQTIQAQAQFLTLQATQVVDGIRREYLQKYHQKTGRNVIVYYSGFLSKQELGLNLSLDLNHEDKNGLMMCIHNLDTSKGLDLFIHTPGGNIAATQSIVNYLHKKFKDNIRAVIPQIAMSAGTMVACSCKEILMCRHSNLGPINPIMGGKPAHGIVDEFKRAYREIKKDVNKLYVWEPILRQYAPTLLTECEYAIKWSDQFVKKQLEEVMFKGRPNAKKEAEKVVKKLSSYRSNKTHGNPLHYEDCKKAGLNVRLIEDDPEFDDEFQDLVLTVHHCFMHSLMNTGSYKMIENHLGAAFVKQVQMVRA